MLSFLFIHINGIKGDLFIFSRQRINLRFSYDSVGNVVSIPYNGTGYYYDAETGSYYLGSRYYNPELCRFISADGQINHGMRGCNIYIYCNNNSVNYYDPSGRACICLTQRVFGNHVCESQKRSPVDDFEIVMTGVGLSVDVGFGLIKSSYVNAERPNNIGKGIYNKFINEQLFGLDNISKKLSRILEGLDYAGVALGTAEGIVNNVEKGESAPKIVWDATVDTAILGANTYISIKSAAIATAAFGPYGLAASVVAGLAVAWGADKIFSPLGDKLGELLKLWVE